MLQRFHGEQLVTGSTRREQCPTAEPRGAPKSALAPITYFCALNTENLR